MATGLANRPHQPLEHLSEKHDVGVCHEQLAYTITQFFCRAVPTPHYLLRYDVSRLQALRACFDIKLDIRTFVESLETLACDALVVYEYISACCTGDESITLFRIDHICEL